MARVVLCRLHKKPSAGSLSDSNDPGPGFWSQPIAGPPGDVSVPTTPHLHGSSFPWFADRHGQSWYLVSESRKPIQVNSRPNCEKSGKPARLM